MTTALEALVANGKVATRHVPSRHRVVARARARRRRRARVLRRRGAPRPQAEDARAPPQGDRARHRPTSSRASSPTGRASSRRRRARGALAAAPVDTLLRAIAQLEGCPIPASVLETEVLPARVPGYRPHISISCSPRARWCGPASRRSARTTAASRSTAPIARRSSRAAAAVRSTDPPRRRHRCTSRSASSSSKRGASSSPRSRGASADYPQDVLEALVGSRVERRGHERLARAAPQPRPRAERAVAVGPSAEASRIAARRQRRVDGRSVARAGSASLHSTERATAIARAMLERYGVVLREAAQAEGLAGRLRYVYDVYRAIEDQGRVRRGYFVAGRGATQFALPGAEERLRTEPRADDDGAPRTRRPRRDRSREPVGLAPAVARTRTVRARSALRARRARASSDARRLLALALARWQQLADVLRRGGAGRLARRDGARRARSSALARRPCGDARDDRDDRRRARAREPDREGARRARLRSAARRDGVHPGARCARPAPRSPASGRRRSDASTTTRGRRRTSTTARPAFGDDDDARGRSMPEGDSIHRLAAKLAPACSSGREVRASTRAASRTTSRETRRRTCASSRSRRAGRTSSSASTTGARCTSTSGCAGASSSSARAPRSGRRSAREPAPAPARRADGASVVGRRHPRAPPPRAGPRSVRPTCRRSAPTSCATGCDEDEVRARASARSASAREIGDALLVQRVAAGIGNVYKSEALFLEGVDPRAPVATLDDAHAPRALAARSALLRRNLGRRPAHDATDARRGPIWVYGRGGRACLRCEGRRSRVSCRGAAGPLDVPLLRELPDRARSAA